MLAIVQHAFGPPDVLDIQELAVPTVGKKDVLVRVHAASVQPGTTP